MRTLKTLALALALTMGLGMSAYAEGPYVGVYLVDETDSKEGALVEDVKAGSPAAKAGLKKGDLIVKFNGVDTPNGAVLIKQILACKPGQKVALVATRGGWGKSIEMVLGAHPESGKKEGPAKPAPSASSSGFLGVYLAPGEGKGAHVDGTVKDSPARKVGLVKGDVIVAVNGKEVGNEQDLIELLRGAKAGDTVSLRVVREGWGKDVKVTLGVRPERPATEGNEPPAVEPKPAPKPTPKPAPKAEKKRGFLGVALDEKDKQVIVDEVQAGSPAEKSGMQKGDVVLAVNGTKIGSINDLAGVLKDKYAGDKLSIVISREGWKRTMEVTLGAAENE